MRPLAQGVFVHVGGDALGLAQDSHLALRQGRSQESERRRAGVIVEALLVIANQENGLAGFTPASEEGHL